MFVTIMLSIMKLFILALGFGLGFFLIISAAKESSWKKILGSIFGWILIVYALAISAMICFLWIDYLSKGKLMDKCPIMQNKQSYGIRGKTQMQSPQSRIEEDREENDEEDDDED